MNVFKYTVGNPIGILIKENYSLKLFIYVFTNNNKFITYIFKFYKSTQSIHS